MHVLELDAQLVRADLREDGARPGANVLAAACEHDGPVRVHVHGRVRGRAAPTTPDLRGHADPAAAVRRRASDPARAAPLPTDLRGADAVALDEVLVGVALSHHGVLR